MLCPLRAWPRSCSGAGFWAWALGPVEESERALAEYRDRQNAMSLDDKKSVTVDIGDGASLNVSPEERKLAAVKKSYAALATAAEGVLSPQLRSRGTVAGDLCQRPRCWYYRLESYKCLKKGGAVCYAVGGENRYHVLFGGGPAYPPHPSNAAVPLAAVILGRLPAQQRQVRLAEFRRRTEPAVRVEVRLPGAIHGAGDVALPGIAVRTGMALVLVR
mgnify:CR=1 FL=1